MNSQKRNDLSKTISRLAFTLAKITLRFNLVFHEFIEMYKYKLAKLAKEQNPEFSIVQLSARTGLDRRYISKILSNEEIKKSKFKVQLVLDEIRRVCQNKNTKLIAKHGKNHSFESICQKLSGSSLTSHAISKELIRLGEIIELERKYKIVNFNDKHIHESLNFYYLSRRISNILTDISIQNNSKHIKKYGENSVESILKKNNIESSIFSKVIKFLIKIGNIKDMGDSYLVVMNIFISDSDERYCAYLTTEIDRVTNTLIENISIRNRALRKLQRNIYSNQINPKYFNVLNTKVIKIFESITLEIYKTMITYEEDVPRGTYPRFGFSVYTYKESN